MFELFDTLSSYINKFVTYVDTLFENIKQSITELRTWIDFLPASLVAAALIIVVMLVVFRILGR